MQKKFLKDQQLSMFYSKTTEEKYCKRVTLTVYMYRVSYSFAQKVRKSAIIE